ncbi:CaiB/BaiF CoA transferase family protein [Rhodococcus koreensis]
MSGFDFLNGITVVEVSQYGPDALGGYLADLGAEVIKVEQPGIGDPVRFSGTHGVGSADGVGFLHLRWNRGKKSVTLDLASSEGAATFKDLAANADVVIEGMRAGALERLGLGYDTLRERNEALVFCSLSGLGSWGNYHTQGSHGPSFDGFAGLLNDTDGPVTDALSAPVGMHSMGLYAAMATCAAVRSAEQTGHGAAIEVAAADCAAHWLPAGLDPVMNEAELVARPGASSGGGRIAHWPRLTTYRTSDGRTIMFQPIKDKYWRRFCEVFDRPDLLEIYTAETATDDADELVHRKLVEFFAERRYDELMTTFLARDIPALPVNSFAELSRDPHFQARANVYEVAGPNGEQLTLTGTPIKVRGQDFVPDLAPLLGRDNASIDYARSGSAQH